MTQSTKLRIALAAVTLFPVIARAADAPNRAPSVAAGPTALEKARGICQKHRVPSSQTITVYPPLDVPEYDSRWQMCHTVEAFWQQTEAARHERERQTAEDADRAFVDQFVSNYGKP